MAACAHLPGKPDLLFTHVPLDEVPAGCGHVHRRTSVDEERINVCVEQIGYRPIPVTDVRRLARRMDQLPPGDAGTTDVSIARAKGFPDADGGDGDRP